jgi:hypothetical protein
MRNYMIFGVIAAMIGVPSAASTFEAKNGVLVAQTANGFVVDGGNGFGARGMWCAAADYAFEVVGAATAQRLYVGNSTGNRNRVAFTLNEQGLSPTSVASVGASIAQPGANLSVAHALSFCADHRLTRQ